MKVSKGLETLIEIALRAHMDFCGPVVFVQCETCREIREGLIQSILLEAKVGVS